MIEGLHDIEGLCDEVGISDMVPEGVAEGEAVPEALPVKDGEEEGVPLWDAESDGDSVGDGVPLEVGEHINFLPSRRADAGAAGASASHVTPPS